MNTDRARVQPWYREPWPWIIMAGPAVVVVASLFTAWLAVRSDDGLVVDDYYKQGLAINKLIRREATAERLGINATVEIADGRVRVRLAGAQGAPSLQFVHPTLAGMDQKIKLTLAQPGVYAGSVRPLRAGRWHVILEQRDWRLAADWTLPAATGLKLGEEHAKEAGR